MASLPDASYPGSVTLAIPASQIEVRITNSNYQKLAHSNTGQVARCSNTGGRT